jgi:nondiscriminating glutamyl-tRNA synthetase
MKPGSIRVRFAPSPTGKLHIGNAHTALFNWLWARKTGGRFILRIEDTDIERSRKKWEAHIINDLRWLGLYWDEGPDCGGEFGPYRQSDRLAIYHDYAQQLLGQGKAYNCYCTSEDLTRRRREQLAQRQPPKYDGRCRQLTQNEKSALAAQGVKPSLRFKITGENIESADIIRGKLEFNLNTFGDFIIMRADGWPTYNFTAVIDDHLMHITHIIRGEDHISNTPKQLLLNQALGFSPPLFAHLPLILDQNHKPLSKREWYSSIGNYQKQGYLPQALLNYLALLGWSPGGGAEEIMSLAELIDNFSLDSIGRSPATFDLKKATWINSKYLQKLETAELTKLCIPYLQSDPRFKKTLACAEPAWLERVVEAVRPELKVLKDVAELAAVYLYDSIIPVLEAEHPTATDKDLEVIRCLNDEISKLDQLTQENFNSLLDGIKNKTGAGGKQLYQPIRLALTGQAHGSALTDLFPVLGKKHTLDRLTQSLKWFENNALLIIETEEIKK